MADFRFTLFTWSIFSFITRLINVLAFKNIFLGVLIRVEVSIFLNEDRALRFFPFNVAGALYSVIEISELTITVSSYVCSALNEFKSFISKILLIWHV